MSQSILRQIAELQQLSLAGLRERWRVLFGTEAPGYSQEMLARRLAFRVQELASGGVSAATRAALRARAEPGGPDGQVRPLVRRDANVGGPVPGTRLVREWHGERHEVTVTAEGFEFTGKLYRSLTAVAKEITGQHWSGALFFGLRSRRGRKD